MLIRPLEPKDRAAWEPLWQGYLTFYKASLADEVTSTTWRRFHDASEPMHVLGAFEGETLIGIVHYVIHRTTWAVGSTCYLQDLFTIEAARGKGVAGKLIDAVYAEAKQLQCNRVYWQTHESNAVAQVLYNKVAQRSGFIVYRMPI